MYKRCITEQSALRQRELEAGLLAAMGSRQYEDITISDLCESMNIPRRAFYRYFNSKEGALYALIDHTLMDFTADFLTGEAQTALDTLTDFFSFWPKRHALLDALERNALSGILVRRAMTLAATEDTFTKRLFSSYSRATREYVITFIVSGLMSLVIHWHHTNFGNEPREMAAIAARLLMQPLFPS